MPGLLVAILLIASLLLVHFSLRRRPMPGDRPLNVDEGLPLPEAGQASTVFSLTALFGAYFGIYLLLGIPALAGLATGSVLGLFAIRHWILRRQPRSFEDFLSGVLSGTKGNVSSFALFICFVQCAYATSELLILREVARVSLGIRSDQATLVAIGVGIIGYFYVLFGGYMAVFRTDILQFTLVGGMVLVFSGFLIHAHLMGGLVDRLLPRPEYWKLPWTQFPPLLYTYHFCLGSVMGLGFLSASPDAWKRVFQVTKNVNSGSFRFFSFIAVGIAPLLVLIPIALTTKTIPNGTVNTAVLFSGMVNSNVLFVAASLGLVASFLSSFDSALLSSVHIGLILQRTRAVAKSEMARFHWLMVIVLISVFLLFTALVTFGNPYFLANLLLGAFALIAGVQVGTHATISRLYENSLLWIFVIGIVCWFVYFVSVVNIPTVPTTYQINTVPGGVFMFFCTILACRVLTIGGRKNDRR